MTTLKTTWGKHPVTLSWVTSSTLPEDYAITSTHGFCFHNGQVVLVKLDTRGWDIPGGHIEDGETAESCFAREVMEEACLEGNAQLIGYVLVDNRDDPHWNSDKYPAIGCQAFYRFDVTSIYGFQQDFESSERIFVAPDEVSSKHSKWNVMFETAFIEALKFSL